MLDRLLLDQWMLYRSLYAYIEKNVHHFVHYMC